MQVIAATGNRHKLQEFERIFAPLGIEIAAQSDVCPALAVERQAKPLPKNAFLKAQAVHRLTGKAAVAGRFGAVRRCARRRAGRLFGAVRRKDLPHSEKIKLLLKELIQVPDESARRALSRISATSARTGRASTRRNAAKASSAMRRAGRAASATIRFSWLGIKASQEAFRRGKDAVSLGKGPAHLHRSFRRDAGINKRKRETKMLTNQTARKAARAGKHGGHHFAGGQGRRGGHAGQAGRRRVNGARADQAARA